MLSKISSMLDAVADSLEKKGLIKEAYEIDKIADAIELRDATPDEIEILKELVKELTSKPFSDHWIPIIKEYEKKYGIQFNVARGSSSWDGVSHPDQTVSIVGTYPRDHQVITYHGNKIQYRSPIDLVPVPRPHKNPSFTKPEPKIRFNDPLDKKQPVDVKTPNPPLFDDDELDF